jgi:ATP-dependent Clp protease ATP-binding subunit ClpC
MNQTLRQRSLEIRLTDEARQWIVEQTCTDRSYGARPLRRALQKFVEDPLSEALIQGRIGAASLVEIFLDGNGLNYRPIMPVELPGELKDQDEVLIG